MSAQLAIAQPRRIKATHRRRRKVAAGLFVQRYYDPQVGRFLSVDPISTNTKTGGNFNRYNYAAGNPYRFTDPDGRAPANTCSRVGGGSCSGSYAGPSGGGGLRVLHKELTGVSAKPARQERAATAKINNAIGRAGSRVESVGTTGQKEAWNNAEWRWDPNNKEFQSSSIGAFVDPADPNTIHVGYRLAEFADSSQHFNYRNAEFDGGRVGIVFGVLHEFGHVVTAGQGTPGPSREDLANKVAYGFLDSSDRKEIKCANCQ